MKNLVDVSIVVPAESTPVVEGMHAVLTHLIVFGLKEKIKSFIKTIAKKKIILFSTHILSEVEDVANRLVIIDKGELVYDDKKPKKKGSVETLFKKLVG